MITWFLIFLYRACFISGLGYTILAFIFGEVLNRRDFTSEIKLSDNLTINPACAVTFMTVFGGAGITTAVFMHPVVSILVSVAFGTLIAFLMFYFILSPYSKLENQGQEENTGGIIGRQATVTEKIPENTPGIIHYYINGSGFSSPAKSENGKEIIGNTLVEIVNIQKSTLYVREVIES